jgi:hypothetical protein
MEGFPVDPDLENATNLAEKIAKFHADKGADLVDLFASFAVMVVQEDSAVGLRCLDVANHWFCDGQVSD